jgi:hypothetical protein
MKRILRVLVVLAPLVWAAVLLTYRLTQVPGALAGFSGPYPPMEVQLTGDRQMGEFHRFMADVRRVVPPRARVVLIGPGRRAWAGPREDHYRQFRLRMLPRPVRAPRTAKELAPLLAWADVVVVYRTPLPTGSIAGFRRVLDLGPEGEVFSREEAGR